MRVLSVVGTRPNLVKMAPVVGRVEREHPRWRHRLVDTGQHAPFLGLVASAACVVTASGGVQEETSHLGIPCSTLRDTTERPVACALGTSTLLGLDPGRIAGVAALLRAGRRAGAPIPGWDGQASARVVGVLETAAPPRRRSGVAAPEPASAYDVARA